MFGIVDSSVQAAKNQEIYRIPPRSCLLAIDFSWENPDPPQSVLL
jgi:hypothetical protein